MFRNHLHPKDVPLFSDGLDVCQRVFDMVRREVGVTPGTPENDLLAAHIVTFYKHGAKTEAQLLILARTAAIT
jgi:hypothetical protein